MTEFQKKMFELVEKLIINETLLVYIIAMSVVIFALIIVHQAIKGRR